MAKKQTITDREIWDLKYTLAEYSVERLKIFKDYIIKGHNKTMPSSILGVDDEEKTKNWIEILEKIIFAFEYILNPEFFVSKGMNVIQCDELKNEGLQLYSKHFEDLWD